MDSSLTDPLDIVHLVLGMWWVNIDYQLWHHIQELSELKKPVNTKLEQLRSVSPLNRLPHLFGVCNANFFCIDGCRTSKNWGSQFRRDKRMSLLVWGIYGYSSCPQIKYSIIFFSETCCFMFMWWQYIKNLTRLFDFLSARS